MGVPRVGAGGEQELGPGPGAGQPLVHLDGAVQSAEQMILEVADHQRVAFERQALAEVAGELGDLGPVGAVELEDPRAGDPARAGDEPVAVEGHGEADLARRVRGHELHALHPTRGGAVEDVDAAAAERRADAVGAHRGAITVERRRPAELLVQAAVRGEELLRLDEPTTGLALEDVGRARVAEDRPGGGGRADQHRVPVGGDREAELVDQRGVRGVPLLPVALSGDGAASGIRQTGSRASQLGLRAWVGRFGKENDRSSP